MDRRDHRSVLRNSSQRTDNRHPDNDRQRRYQRCADSIRTRGPVEYTNTNTDPRSKANSDSNAQPNTDHRGRHDKAPNTNTNTTDRDRTVGRSHDNGTEQNTIGHRSLRILRREIHRQGEAGTRLCGSINHRPRLQNSARTGRNRQKQLRRATARKRTYAGTDQ